jgi:serine/threonine protein phosphatase 1
LPDAPDGKEICVFSWFCGSCFLLSGCDMTGNWKTVLRLEKNRIGRDFVCGDIHGCFDDLETGLVEKNFDKEKDRLFSVGDLIDRGPRSDLAAFYMDQPWFFTVMGNHEHLFLMGSLDIPGRLDYWTDHLLCGGGWAYKMEPEKQTALLDAVDRLPLIIQAGDVIITHAALPAVDSLETIEEKSFAYMETLLWHRGAYPPVAIPGIRRVYVGHTPTSRPYRSGKTMNIDTGAFRKYHQREGKLTILESGGE